MSVSFLTPLGAAVAALAVLPLAALALRRRRATRMRERLGLQPPPQRRVVAPLAALAATAALVGGAASQPVLERTVDRPIRTDAEAYVVVDITRSMLASGSAAGEQRIERAKEAAATIRAALPTVPVGMATFTDRVLPHVFPTADADVFGAALAQSIGVERPPPRISSAQRATSLDALSDLATRSFFSPQARRRVAVVVTDGEADPIATARVARLFARPPRIRPLFVHVWGADERVFNRGVPEPQYRSDPSARPALESFAVATGGRVFDERSLDDAVRATREALGEGPVERRGTRKARTALAPFAAVAAFLPLAALLALRDR